MVKRYEELTISDDFMFGKAMGDKVLCQDVLELPKRSRFYQSTMDTDHLSKGKSYRELPEGRVLFLCTFDPFGKGYAKYSFQNLCKEDRELYLKDGTEKIFYNCAADPEKVPENLRELYDYIRSGKVGGDLSQRIDEAVCRARKNEEWSIPVK